MKTRIVTALVLLCIFVPILIFSDTIVFPAAIGIIAAIGAYEYLKCIGYGKRVLVYFPACAISFFLPLFAHFSRGIGYIVIVLAVAFSYMFYLFAYAVFCRGRESFSHVAGAFTGVFYILFSLTCLVIIRRMNYGEYIYLLAFIGAWITDTFAYFTGWVIGKHKLIPEISPKKTIEGAVGGIVFCTLFFAMFGLFVSSKIGVAPNYIALCISAIFVSVISQIGDLVFSLIKREHGVKDYGRIFPGHGGVLDRFDSVIPVSVVLLIIMSLSEKFLFFK